MTPLQAAGLRRLNAMMRQTRDPLFVLDPQVRLVYVNPAWEALTGLSADRVLGRPWVAGEDDPAWGLHGSLTTSLAPPPEVLDGHPGGGVTPIPSVTGQMHRRRVEFWPHFDENGQSLGWLATIRDEDANALVPESRSLSLRVELGEIRESLRGRVGEDDLIGRGARHERLLEQIKAAATSSAPVLIVGEPGTGRSLVARTIHNLGTARDAPLFPLDVNATPADTIESFWRDLLADPSTQGVASLLLRDALDLPRDLQASLTGLIAKGRLRVLATTRIAPELAFRDERIREDFYFAMTPLVIPLAPLRDRLDELPLIAHAFLDRANRGASARRGGFDPRALAVLQEYDWPGNLGELGRVIASAHARGTGAMIQVEDLPAAIRGSLGSAYAAPVLPPATTPMDLWLMQLERRLIDQALRRARQNKSRAAEMLGISRPRLYRRIKELNIPDEPEPTNSDGD